MELNKKPFEDSGAEKVWASRACEFLRNSGLMAATKPPCFHLFPRFANASVALLGFKFLQPARSMGQGFRVKGFQGLYVHLTKSQGLAGHFLNRSPVCKVHEVYKV